MLLSCSPFLRPHSNRHTTVEVAFNYILYLRQVYPSCESRSCQYSPACRQNETELLFVASLFALSSRSGYWSPSHSFTHSLTRTLARTHATFRNRQTSSQRYKSMKSPSGGRGSRCCRATWQMLPKLWANN